MHSEASDTVLCVLLMSLHMLIIQKPSLRTLVTISRMFGVDVKRIEEVFPLLNLFRIIPKLINTQPYKINIIKHHNSSINIPIISEIKSN